MLGPSNEGTNKEEMFGSNNEGTLGPNKEGNRRTLSSIYFELSEKNSAVCNTSVEWHLIT